jgi:hypothetical protein
MSSAEVRPDVIRGITYCISAVLFVATSAFARIGETEAQIEKRYGKSTSGSGPTKGYFYKGFFIIVTFDNGVSGIETYEKRSGAQMTAAEIRQLLRANGAATKSHEPIQNGFDFQYEENNRLAEYKAATSTLTIAEPTALKRVNTRHQTLDIAK